MTILITNNIDLLPRHLDLNPNPVKGPSIYVTFYELPHSWTSLKMVKNKTKKKTCEIFKGCAVETLQTKKH